MIILRFFIRLFKSVLTTVLSLLLILILTYAALFAVGFWISDQFSDVLVDKEIEIQHNSTLLIKLQGELIDEPSSIRYPVNFDIFGINQEDATSVQEIIRAVEFARTDDRIDNIVIDIINFNGGGTALLHEVAEKLTVFSQTKPVTTIASYLSNSNYIIASASNQIFLDDFGSVWIDGYGKFQLYLKDSLEEIGITFDVFTAGNYKSAAESVSRNSMSEYDRFASKRWLDDLWSLWLESVKSRRPTMTAQIDAFTSDPARAFTENKGNATAIAMNSGLVDQVIPSSDYSTLNASYLAINEISHTDYLNARKTERHNANYYTEREKWIALVYGTGVINQGGEGDSGINPDEFSDRILNLLDEDKNPEGRGTAAALVIRLNTPGGSVFGSEKIKRAIQEVQTELDIPVLVSFSAVGASGGMWVASQADYIMAHPSTITGSIGVVATLPNFTGLADKLEANYDGVGTTPYSGFSYVKPLPQPIASAINATISHTYSIFKQAVATKSGLSLEAVETIAGGQVWTGRQAAELQLIDGLGGMETALAQAATLANINEDEYVVYSLRPELEIDDLLQLISQFAKARSFSVIMTEMFGAVGFSYNTSQRWLKEHLTLSAKQSTPLPIIRVECIECGHFATGSSENTNLLLGTY